MSRYFVKRILQTIPLMLVISILVFLFIHMIRREQWQDWMQNNQK